MILHEWQLPNGRSLAWREAGEGTTPLVLLHGWSLSGAAFAELAGLLGEFRLLCPDLPGHGRSAPPREVTLAALADDVAAWLAALNPGPVILGGWSLGGMVAVELAARQTTAIDRLLLLATSSRFTRAPDWPHGLPVGQVLALRRNLERHFEATLGEFFDLSFASGEVDADRLRAIRTFAVRPGGLPDRAAASEFLTLLAQQDQRDRPAAVSCPVLVLHGSDDRVIPVDAGRVLAAAFSQGRFLEMTGTGHAPLWTRPDQVSRAIREFC